MTFSVQDFPTGISFVFKNIPGYWLTPCFINDIPGYSLTTSCVFNNIQASLVIFSAISFWGFRMACLPHGRIQYIDFCRGRQGCGLGEHWLGSLVRGRVGRSAQWPHGASRLATNTSIHHSLILSRDIMPADGPGAGSGSP